jgi:hypothetical protein
MEFQVKLKESLISKYHIAEETPLGRFRKLPHQQG